MNEIYNAANFYYEEDNNKVQKINSFINKYKMKAYNFASKKERIITQKNKKRRVYYYEKDTFEYIMCSHFSFVLSKKFKITYNDRNKIIKELINSLQLIKNITDFTIIRFDFKDYFNSISSAYVFEKYLKNADISRELLNIMKEFFEANKNCSAGFPTSNLLAELISKDFDIELKAKLSQYGVIYYERYVDDGLLILNSYIDSQQFLDIVNNTIKKVFYDPNYPLKNQKVRLNNNKTKIINNRLFNNNVDEITFLGYLIILKNNNESIKLEFGITNEKMKKYQNKFNLIIEDYKKNQIIELLRHRILLFTRRVVYTVPNIKKDLTWLSKGVVSNYNELRHFDSILQSDTKQFLKECVEEGFTKHNVQMPYFMKGNSKQSYELYSNLMKNRSIIFDEKIGVSKKDLIKYCNKIGVAVNSNETYENILCQYLQKIKI